MSVSANVNVCVRVCVRVRVRECEHECVSVNMNVRVRVRVNSKVCAVLCALSATDELLENMVGTSHMVVERIVVGLPTEPVSTARSRWGPSE
jgi:hypothetical protein